MKTEVEEVNKKVHDQFQSAIRTVCTEKEMAQNFQRQIDVIKQFATDLQTYIALRKMSTDVLSSEQILQTMKENGSIDKVTLECDIDDGLAQITSGIQSFGQIRVHKTPRHITLESHKDKQAQVEKEKSQSLDKIELKLVKTLNIESKHIYGCSFVRDGKLIFTDYFETRLICVDSEGKQLFTVSSGSCRAIDVTCIDDTTVAVTSAGHMIIIVDISTCTVKKHINVGYFCYGVTHRSGTLLVCAKNHGILSINMTNEKITTVVQCDDLSNSSYITTYNDKLYYTNSNSKSVMCCDMEGNKIWTFADGNIFYGPHGIATDNEGRVYVADTAKSAVIVLSPDGRQSKQILSYMNGLSIPHALSIDKTRNRLLVANFVHKIFLFDLLS